MKDTAIYENVIGLKEMKLKCLHCEHEFDGTATFDELGWHSSCPKCERSFDVDIDYGSAINKHITE